MKKHTPYRLAIDSGIASFGWAMYQLDRHNNPEALVDGGVLIFPKAEKAEDRRHHRSARKTNERKKSRLERIADLFQHQLNGYDRKKATQSILNTSPYKLRSKALDHKISLEELERIILHMAKHRGSNAAALDEEKEGSQEKEDGKVAEAAQRTKKLMEEKNARTYGQLLWRMEKKSEKIRISKNDDTGTERKAYDFFPLSGMIRDEFDQIMKKQRECHDGLTDALIGEIRNELFFERDKKAPFPGECMFVEGELRLPRCNRLFQMKRIYEEVNNLRITLDRKKRPLTLEERDTLVQSLVDGEDLDNKKIGEKLRLAAHSKLYMGKKRKINIAAYPFNRLFASDDDLNQRWQSLSEEKQDQLLDILAGLKEDGWIITTENRIIKAIEDLLGCDRQTASKIHKLPVPDDYGELGETATKKVLEVLKAKHGLATTEALLECGYQAKTAYDGSLKDRLPYYGIILKGHTAKRPQPLNDRADDNLSNEELYGKIPNPVVHRALCQLRKLINGIIKKYGRPTEIHLELGREMSMNDEERDRYIKQQDANAKRNQEIRKKLEELSIGLSHKNKTLYKLWERQGGICAYTGQQIGLPQLFTDEIHIDHVLPYSKTFEDGLNNKVVCFGTANLKKGNNTPYQAFADNPDYDYAAIMRRVEDSPGYKKKRYDKKKKKQVEHNVMAWRFQEDALEKHEQEATAFGEAALNDHRYIARAMSLYLSCICPREKIVCSTGRMTSNLRQVWGLMGLFCDNSPLIQEFKEKTGKEDKRVDHRHHFMDAVTIGGITRSIVQKVETKAARIEDKGQESDFYKEVFKPLKPPFDQDRLQKQFVQHLRSMRPAVKPDHKRQGQLHKDTTYSIVDGPVGKDKKYIVRIKRKTRKLEKIGPGFRILESILDSVSDPEAKEELTKAAGIFENIKQGIKDYQDDARIILEAENQQLEEEGKKSKKITEKALFAKQRELYLATPGAIHSYRSYESKTLIFPRRAIIGNKPAFGLESGRNLRVDFYKNAKEKICWKLISRYDGIRIDHKNEAFRPQSTRPGHTLLFSLYKDDIVEMNHPDNPDERIRARVYKFSEGKLMVGPVLDARMETDGRQNYGDKGLTTYQEWQLQQIKLNALGDILWRSPRLTP